jgi:hypothetical protein
MSAAVVKPSADLDRKLTPLWHRSAPQRLVETCRAECLSDGWKVWKKHLHKRKSPRPTPFLSGKQLPILWGLDSNSDFGFRISDLCMDEEITSQVAAVEAGTNDGIESALAEVARAYALPELAERLPAESWWKLVEQLHDTAVRAESIRVDLQSDPEDLVRQQLLAGELPLALGYLFPELRALRELRESARAALSESLIEWTDGQGLPHGRLSPVFGPLWACWTRARWMGEQLKRGCWSREAEVQYQWCVRHAIRLTDANGRLMLLSEDEHLAERDSDVCLMGLHEMALSLVGDASDYAAAKSALPRRAFVKRKNCESSHGKLPDVSLNSEWSGIGVLASDWSRSAVRLAVAWAERPMAIKLSIGQDELFTGDWTFRTTCDREPVSVIGEWEQFCWQSDKKCDYLELGIELSHGLRLERQLLLARDDRVLFLADTLISDKELISANELPRRITHAMDLPMHPSVEWRPEKETRDGLLVSNTQRAAVLPLALAEWRSDPRSGQLEFANEKLTLTHEGNGRALYCPVLFDLDRKRTTSERTWRRLTVAEMLEIVPSDLAVGYRAQSGRDQWLIYRSLGPAGNRTLIGQNIAGEFFAGRLRKSGKLDEWIEIEAVENDEARMTNDE